MTTRIGGQPVTRSPEPNEVQSDTSTVKSPETQEKETISKEVSKSYGSAVRTESSLTGAVRAAEITSRFDAKSVDATPTTTAAVEAKEVKEPLLYNPSKGPKVLELQKQINEWRIQNGKEPIKEDEVFGPKTETAVKEFQKAAGLKADGLVGPLTRERLKLENDKNFQSLDSDTKVKVRDQLNSNSKNPAARKDVIDLVTTDDFGKISKDGQEDALKKLNEKPGDPGHAASVNQVVQDRAYLETHNNFQMLDSETKAKVLEQFKNCPDRDARLNLSYVVLHSDFGKLSPEHKELSLKVLQNNPSDSQVSDNLRVVISDKNFVNMQDANKTKVLDLMAKNANGPYAKEMRDLITNPKFGAMSHAEQTQTLNVFEGTTPAGRTALMKLMDKEVDGKPVLSSKGVNGTGPTLLENLNRLATTPMDARVVDSSGTPIDRAGVMEDLLKEVSEPTQNLNQGNRGTCPVTSMSSTLCQKNPAEYARIVTDLATTGNSKLANGDAIQVPADAFMSDGSGRSASERLFQSATMNYGAGGTYNNWTPSGQPNTVGLNGTQNVKVMSALYNKPMEQYWPANKQDLLNRTKEEINKGNAPVFTGFTWGTGNHAVEVLKITGDPPRVYYRNPWGASGAPGGPVSRQSEDASTGLESISLDDYLANANDIIVPKKEVK